MFLDVGVSLCGDHNRTIFVCAVWLFESLVEESGVGDLIRCNDVFYHRGAELSPEEDDEAADGEEG